MLSGRSGRYRVRCMRCRGGAIFNPDYKDLLRLFTEHGVVRATGDIDLFVRATSKNAAAVFDALAEFGAPLSNITADDFAVPGTVYQIGVQPNRIDILTEIDGVSYEEVGRVMLNVDDLTVPFLNLSSLKRNKAPTGRARDKLDLELLNEGERPES